jgi:alkylation response protein AidB-like acyl-CoA dehydrogenase
MATQVERELPDDESRELLALVRDIADAELIPNAASFEHAEEFPREIFRTLGRSGLLTLAHPEEYGGGGLTQYVYLQVIEELSAAWLTVGMGTSVHSLGTHSLAKFADTSQKEEWLRDSLSGERLNAYCLSEAHAGSDAKALTTLATRDGDGWVLQGSKAWITHGGVADNYTVIARTSTDGDGAISAFWVPAHLPGVIPATPERKMGLRGSHTATVNFDSVRLPVSALLGEQGHGMKIALDALNYGRLAIAACAVGVAQAALEVAVQYSRERMAFGQRIGDFQGVHFLLADMATQVSAARQLYLAGARRLDSGTLVPADAAMAKLFATDMAMAVTTDAVQVLGGAGYTEDFPVERYMREVKVLQILEGTNQIQRSVIGRHLVGR